MRELFSMVYRGFGYGVGRKVAYVVVGLVVAFVSTQCHAAQCVLVGEGGALLADGAAADACAGFLLLSPQEFADMQSLWVPLSIDDGVRIGVSIFVAWTIAFGFTIIRRAVEETGEPSDTAN